jgi:hypothetical protein
MHPRPVPDSQKRLFTALVAANDLVVIDVSQPEFVDSSFVHNLVKADRLSPGCAACPCGCSTVQP